MENIISTNQTKIKKKGVFRFYPKSLIAFVLILALSFVEYKYNVSYTDEATAVMAFVIILASAPRISKRDGVTLVFVGSAIALGLLANALFDIAYSWFSVFVDVISQLKCPLAFFATKYAMDTEEKQQTIELLVPIAKVYLVINAMLAVVSQFVSTPFIGSLRYGLRSYKFIFTYTQQYSAVTFVLFGAIVCSKKIPEKTRRIYLFFGLIAAVASFKSFSIVFTTIFIVFYFFFKKYSKLSMKIIVPLAIVLLLLSSYQIDTYLLDETSPRRLFIHYSMVDATQHFPLGSGFATFGSSEASKHYSRLYYEYGFSHLWGMAPDDPKFLNDTYWPTVIGQLGWIGAAMFITMYVRIFQTLGFADNSNSRKAYLYAFFGEYMVHAIGSAILQNSAGLLGFLMIGICTVVDEKKENRPPRRKFHIEI